MPAARRPALFRAICVPIEIRQLPSCFEVGTLVAVIKGITMCGIIPLPQKSSAPLIPSWATESVGSVANRGASFGSRGMAWLKDPNQQPQQREPALRIDGGSETGGAHDEALVPTPCPRPPTADGFRVGSPRHYTSHCVRRAEAAFLTHCFRVLAALSPPSDGTRYFKIKTRGTWPVSSLALPFLANRMSGRDNSWYYSLSRSRVLSIYYIYRPLTHRH